MEGFGVGDSVGPESIEDLDPALGEASQGGVVIGSGGSLLLVVVCGPTAIGESGLEGEEEQGLVDRVVAGTAPFDAS